MNTDLLRDVIGVGCVALDTILVIDKEITVFDTKVAVRARECRLGGLTAVALAAAARFGSSVAYAGLLGADPASQQVESLMEAAGVDVSTAVRRPTAKVIEADVLVGLDPPTRYILYTDPALAGADAVEPIEEVLLSAGVLICDGFSPIGALRAARIFRSHGRPVVLDVETDHGEVTHALVDMADHLILSWDFASTYAGAETHCDTVRALWHSDRSVVVVTGGAAGCWMTHAGIFPDVVHIPALPVKALDTTGCGDVFHGVYAALLLREPSAEKRIQQATAAAAAVAASGRGSSQLPDVEDVRRLISSIERSVNAHGADHN